VPRSVPQMDFWSETLVINTNALPSAVHDIETVRLYAFAPRGSRLDSTMS